MIDFIRLATYKSDQRSYNIINFKQKSKKVVEWEAKFHQSSGENAPIESTSSSC